MKDYMEQEEQPWVTILEELKVLRMDLVLAGKLVAVITMNSDLKLGVEEPLWDLIRMLRLELMDQIDELQALDFPKIK